MPAPSTWSTGSVFAVEVRPCRSAHRERQSVDLWRLSVLEGLRQPAGNRSPLSQEIRGGQGVLEVHLADQREQKYAIPRCLSNHPIRDLLSKAFED